MEHIDRSLLFTRDTLEGRCLISEFRTWKLWLDGHHISMPRHHPLLSTATNRSPRDHWTWNTRRKMTLWRRCHGWRTLLDHFDKVTGDASW